VGLRDRGEGRKRGGRKRGEARWREREWGVGRGSVP